MRRAAFAVLLGSWYVSYLPEALAQPFESTKFLNTISDKYKNVFLIGVTKADERGRVTIYFTADTVAQVSMGQIQRRDNWFVGTCSSVNNDARWVCLIEELSAKGYWFE